MNSSVIEPGIKSGVEIQESTSTYQNQKPDDPLKCGEVFLNQTGTLTLVCALCGRIFRNLENLGEHLTSVHCPGRELKTFFDETLNQEAIEAISDDSIQEFKVFEEVNLLLEEKTHEQIPRYDPFGNIPTDRYIYSSSQNTNVEDERDPLNLEANEMIPINIPKKVAPEKLLVPSCRKCCVRFKYKESYSLHMNIKHGDLTKELLSKVKKYSNLIIYMPYKCLKCNSEYRSKNRLVEHFKKLHNLDADEMRKIMDEETKQRENEIKELESEQCVKNEESNSRAGSNVLNSNCREELYADFQLEPPYAHIKHTYQRLVEEMAPKVIVTSKDLSRVASNSENQTERKQPGHFGMFMAQCGRCGLRFKTDQCHEKHKRLKHSELPSSMVAILKKEPPPILYVPFVCSVCGSQFKFRGRYVMHLKRKHSLDPKKVKEIVEEENRISRGDQGTQETPCKPEECKPGFATVAQNKNHRFFDFCTQTDHAQFQTRKSFPCRYCGKCFHQKLNLILHIREHTGEMPYKCPECPRNFARRNSVVIHLRIHQRIKDYQNSMRDKPLETCTEKNLTTEKHLTTEKNLTVAKKKPAVSQAQQKPHRCELCGKCFAKPFLLRDHVLGHYNIRNFECKECNKKYTSPRHLSGHRRRCHKMRKFGCNICGLQLTSKFGWRTHMDLHSNTQKYKCQICGKGFIQLSSYNSHRKLHENYVDLAT